MLLFITDGILVFAVVINITLNDARRDFKLKVYNV